MSVGSVRVNSDGWVPVLFVMARPLRGDVPEFRMVRVTVVLEPVLVGPRSRVLRASESWVTPFNRLICGTEVGALVKIMPPLLARKTEV